MSVHDHLLRLLAAVPHERIEHAPIQSAAHAAKVRGTPPEIGGKALLMKLGKRFAVVAIPGDRRLDGRRVRKELGVQRYRFARREELLEHTGLAPGSVPPFGRPLFDLPLFVDANLASQPRVAFTMGRPTTSAVLAMADYMNLAQPEGIATLTSTPEPR